MIRIALFALVAALCTACSQFPELGDAVSPRTEGADYLDLMPFDTLLAQDTPGAQADTNLSARSAALRARAARLRATVIDTGTRQRMASGVASR